MGVPQIPAASCASSSYAGSGTVSRTLRLRSASRRSCSFSGMGAFTPSFLAEKCAAPKQRLAGQSYCPRSYQTNGVHAYFRLGNEAAEKQGPTRTNRAFDCLVMAQVF